MFDLTKLERIVRGDESGINVYAYNTSDTISEVMAANYFPASLFDDAEVNIIDVYSDDEFAPLRYSKPSATAIRNDAQGSGWAQYSDTQYTSGSPFTVTQGNTVALPINAGGSITSHLPSGVTALYNGTRITPENIGDFYTVRVNFNGYSSANNGAFSINIDISSAGDGSNVIASEPTRMIRGAGSGNVQVYTTNMTCFSLGTFVANGGLVRVTAVDGDLTLYGATLVISRIHKGG